MIAHDMIRHDIATQTTSSDLFSLLCLKLTFHDRHIVGLRERGDQEATPKGCVKE